MYKSRVHNSTKAKVCKEGSLFRDEPLYLGLYISNKAGRFKLICNFEWHHVKKSQDDTYDKTVTDSVQEASKQQPHHGYPYGGRCDARRKREGILLQNWSSVNGNSDHRPYRHLYGIHRTCLTVGA